MYATTRSSQTSNKLDIARIKTREITTKVSMDVHDAKGRFSCLESQFIPFLHLCRVVRKPAFCICKNKDADQLRGNREADQRLCFCYIDSMIPLLSKSEISSF